MENDSDCELIVLREALDNQGRLLQRLYEELDEEREASSTAASEAMSMILRLQEEKASVAMEALQYRRMSEEKLQYAQESLAVFEQLMYMKEMEIKSLEFQVLAFKHKLLILGMDDFDIESMDKVEEQSYVFHGQTGNVSRLTWVKEENDEEEKEEEEEGRQRRRMPKVKRNPSLPPINMKSSICPSHRENLQNNPSSSKKIGPSPRWSTIKTLSIKDEEDDKIVEVRCGDEVDGHKSRRERDRVVSEGCRSNSDPNHVSFKSLSRFSSFHSAVCNDEDADCGNDPELVRSAFSFSSCQSEEYGMYLSKMGINSCFAGSGNEIVKPKKNNELCCDVHDIFEAPKHQEGGMRNCEKIPIINMDDGDRIKKPNLPIQHKTKERLFHQEKASTSSIGELHDTQALCKRLKQMEDVRECMKQEDARRTMQEFKLLNDICERLDKMQFQIDDKKSDKQSSRTNTCCIVSIIEAILRCST